MILTVFRVVEKRKVTMIETKPYPDNRTWQLSRATVVFAWLVAGLLVVVGVLGFALFGSPVLPVIVFCLISTVCLFGLLHSYPHDVLGTCNVVTLIRTALVALLTGAIFAPSAPWLVFGIAVIAFSSDGLDGWLARRSALTSVFGARFDMEADALLGAVLALILSAHGTVGPSILVLGFSRYVFVAFGWVWPALQGELSESYRRKTICVVQIASLIALVCPLTPAVLLPWIAAGAAALLLFSFAVDAWTLVRRAA